MARRKRLIKWLLCCKSFLRKNRIEESCSNLDSDEDMRLSENDCEESTESVDVIDNIPVNPDIYVCF
ncbi:hypothetical protein TNCV_598181 [Trichonephila clavipes]|nr:hypothetical protein TNCV_598181 [Trichonephila clavipes]